MQLRDLWKSVRANTVLRSLPQQDALFLSRSLRRISLNPGDRISPGETDFIYFPETLVVCLIGPQCNSAVGMIGREGLVGWETLFRSRERSHQLFVAITGGSALVISSERLRALMAAQPGLAISLGPFLQSFAEQMGNTILATLHGSLEARLCGWLLMMHERIEGDELRITHRTLGNFLNVRRASVTDALHVLEGERVLRCTRGRVVVIDPVALQFRSRLTHVGMAPTRRSGVAAASVPDTRKPHCSGRPGVEPVQALA